MIHLTALLALSLSSPALASDEPKPAIPERFHGDWSSDLSKCGDRESGLNLNIEAGFITYFEAADTVLAVRPAELDGINIHVRHEDYDGMEETYRTLILSDDRQTLTFTYGDGPEFVSYRCPQGKQDG